MGRGRSGAGQEIILTGQGAIIAGWFGIVLSLLLVGLAAAVLLRTERK